MTAPVWIRGILSDHYAVPVDSVTYARAARRTRTREKIKLDLPSNIRVQPIGPTQTLPRCLQAARSMRCTRLACRRRSPAATAGKAAVSELPRGRAAYFRDTGIFPIMHAIVIRRDVYEQNRWIAQSLFKAFVEAQRQTYDDLYVTAALKAMLPWLTDHVEETRALMGDDYWSYGFARNRPTLATFLRYHHEQGLSKRLLTPEELFAPEAMESFRI
jgi:4,5-dihydroxyphthalate decarboxylase